MSPVLLIEEPRDTVTYKVLVDGISVGEQYDIMQVMVTRSFNRIPFARIVVSDGDPAAGDFPASSEGTFDPGKQVEIRAGYESNEESIFKGEITGQKISTSNDSPSELTVDCRDKAYKMTLQPKDRLFENVSDNDVMASILQEYGLENEIGQAREIRPHLVQHQVTDWDFLNLRAEACNLLITVEDGKFRAIEPSSFVPTGITLNYGTNVTGLEASIDARTQVPGVVARSWSSADQEVQESEAAEPSPGMTPGDLSGSTLGGNNGSPITLVHPGESGAGELRDWAGGLLSRSRLSKVMGTIQCQGDARFKPGTTVTLARMGDHFNGNALISGITHRIRRGDWESELSIGVDPEPYARKYSGEIGVPQASGLVSPASGLSIAVVTSLEDPEDAGRIRIRIPMVTGEEELWARIATLDAGNNRGTYFRPELGDEVVVGFLHDDPASPVVLGMLHSRANPAPAQASNDNHEKGLVSRSGIKFWIDDDKKTLSLSTPGGYKLLLDEDAGTIELKDANGNVVTMKKDGMTISTDGDLTLKAGGNIEIKGNDIKVKASMNFKAEGMSGAEVSASGNTIIKGALVQIN